MRYLEKAKSWLHKFCELLEMVLAFVITIGLILTFVKYFVHPQMYLGILNGSFSVTELINKTFDLIIGIEFIQMLCRPKSDNVLEMIIFLISRHLIVHYGNSLMDFLSIAVICGLCILRHMMSDEEEAQGSFLGKLKKQKNIEE